MNLEPKHFAFKAVYWLRFDWLLKPDQMSACKSSKLFPEQIQGISGQSVQSNSALVRI